MVHYVSLTYHSRMAPEVQPETPVSWFHTRATHYVEAQMLFHLSQVGVMTELHRGPARAEDIAERLHLDVHVLRTMLDYVVGIDNLLSLGDNREYTLTEFGRQVFARFAKNESMEEFNFFDVRVGCFGPVWHNLGNLVTGTARYGQDFQREGRFAAQGVSKLARHLIKPIDEAVAQTGSTHIVVVGVTPGLVDVIADHHPDAALFGLDRERTTLDTIGVNDRGEPLAQPVQGDFFKPGEWAAAVRGAPPATGLLVSIHFHEFLAHGIDAMSALIGDLRAHFPGWHVLALEQDRLPESARADTPHTLWLYAHSNVLIHHLIGNARILSREEWLDVLTVDGGRMVDVINAGYLGYNGYLIAL